MAKVISNRRCVKCGKPNVMLWTLDNLQRVGVMYLCTEHSKPLLEALDAAGDLPPDEQLPLTERDDLIDDDVAHMRGRREPKLVPLLDWTPPLEIPMPPA